VERGGAVVYCTCSLLAQESEEVVRNVVTSGAGEVVVERMGDGGRWDFSDHIFFAVLRRVGV
jgi:16S rRNA C967 or C1407 C5-methylase (RsmB/RsmF family)